MEVPVLMSSPEVGEHPHSGEPTHTGTSFTTKTTNPNPDFDTGISFTTKTTKPNPDFAKALRRSKSVESHPHAGRVKEKPLLLSSNYIQTGRESLPTNGLLSSRKDIMSKPDVVELCVQKSQGDHVRKLQFMNKKATTHAQVIH